MVPVGDRAPLCARGEIGPQPRFLRRAGAHVDVAVQRNDVPGAEIVAVVAQPGRPGLRPEVAEVTRGARRVMVVVAGRGAGARLVPAPRRGVALRIARAPAAAAGVVPRGG